MKYCYRCNYVLPHGHSSTVIPDEHAITIQRVWEGNSVTERDGANWAAAELPFVCGSTEAYTKLINMTLKKITNYLYPTIFY